MKRIKDYVREGRIREVSKDQFRKLRNASRYEAESITSKEAGGVLDFGKILKSFVKLLRQEAKFRHRFTDFILGSKTVDNFQADDLTSFRPFREPT